MLYLTVKATDVACQEVCRLSVGGIVVYIHIGVGFGVARSDE